MDLNLSLRKGVPLAPGCLASARAHIESSFQHGVDLTGVGATLRLGLELVTPHAHPAPVSLRARTRVIAHAPSAPFAPFCVAFNGCKNGKKYL